MSNEGFEPRIIQEYREKMKRYNRDFIMIDSEDNSDEFKNFFFIGSYEGREVVYDAAVYTLRLHHKSELYEIAEHRAAKRFPEYKQIKYREDENGDLAVLDDLEEEIGLFMSEVMMELEEEEEVRVKEHVEIDSHIDFGVGLDVALNVPEVTSAVISQFVKDFTSGKLQLDDTLYTFHLEEEDEEAL